MTETDWAEEAVRLRREERMATAEIVERVGKSASQVRRVIAAANAERHVGAEGNGNGPHDGYYTGNEPEFADIHAAFDAPEQPIPGQTTVDEHLESEFLDAEFGNYGTPPEDDPAHPDALAAFRAQAGEPVGPMPPPAPPEDPGPVESRLAGTRQLALDFGPNADTPVGGTLVIRSDKLASGFYGLGDIVTGTFTARVVDVAGKERLQRASEEFRAQPQHHVALITEIAVDVPGAG